MRLMSLTKMVTKPRNWSRANSKKECQPAKTSDNECHDDEQEPTTTTTSRLDRLPRELRDKIYEFSCYNDGVFSLPNTTGLGKEIGSELKESFVRESKQIWKADEATVSVSKECNISWRKLPDSDGIMRLYIGLPHDTSSQFPNEVGKGGDWSPRPKTSWLWRCAIDGYKNKTRMTSCPDKRAITAFLKWLGQQSQTVAWDKLELLQEMESLLLDFDKDSRSVCEPLSPVLKKELLKESTDEKWRWSIWESREYERVVEMRRWERL